jgi:putative transposase
MPQYRRNWVEGGTYFFTVNLRDRTSNLLVDHVAELREAVRIVRLRAPFQIDAWVVLPDHMHCVWTMPRADANYAQRWRAIKTRFSKALHVNAGRSGIWQPRYWEHTIRDERDYASHIDYTHLNPVKHGFATRPDDWPFSSFRRWVAEGMYPSDWVGSNIQQIAANERP